MATDINTEASVEAEAEALAEATVEAEAATLAEAGVEVEATAATTAKAKASSDAEYKSDALDELLEDSLFKKKKPDNTPESQVDQALHAKVDIKEFGLGDEKKEADKKSEELEVAPGSVPDPDIQAAKDAKIIQ
jgi:hypothetical protein